MTNSASAQSEVSIQNDIRLACGHGDSRLWRLNCGNFLLADGRRITVGAPGMSDLIGLRSVTITPEMVGTRVAVFAALEVKRPDVRARPEHQAAFIRMVQQMGGIADFVTSVEEAKRALDP